MSIQEVINLTISTYLAPKPGRFFLRVDGGFCIRVLETTSGRNIFELFGPENDLEFEFVRKLLLPNCDNRKPKLCFKSIEGIVEYLLTCEFRHFRYLSLLKQAVAPAETEPDFNGKLHLSKAAYQQCTIEEHDYYRERGDHIHAKDEQRALFTSWLTVLSTLC